jgi:zinc transport system substrate-binding protein
MRKNFFWLLLACALAACVGGKNTPSPTQKPLLLVSIPPYLTIVQRIAGDGFEVQAVVPPNTNPHSYEPTSRQVATLHRGAVWFQIGEPFEAKLEPLLSHTAPVDLRAGISMIDHEVHHCEACGQDHLDRHIWLSPKQTALQVAAIADDLSHRYPEQAQGIRERAAALQGDLESLDREISATLAQAAAKTFLVSHPAFAYFCRDYDLKQLSVEQEGKDPRPRDLDAIYRAALQTQTEVAIALPQYNNKGAQLIAERLHIPVKMIDPYSSEYFETMRALAAMIANPYPNDE